MKKVFMVKISKSQQIDTGMAMVLILLFLGLYFEDLIWVKYAFVVLLLNMIIPVIFKYIAVVWFGISKILGLFVSKVVLSGIFFLVVLPIGFIRRILGHDSLRLKEFKKDISSVMVTRNQTYSKEHIEKPY